MRSEPPQPRSGLLEIAQGKLAGAQRSQRRPGHKGEPSLGRAGPLPPTPHTHQGRPRRSRGLAAIVADVIYTVPIFTLHSPDAGVLRSLFRPFGLAMIKTFESDGRPAPGFDVVKKIILARIDEKAVDPGALDLLVRKTGGVLQHAFEVLRNAALMDSATLPLKEKEIVEALKVKRSEFWSEIALPIEPVPGVASVEQLYDRLTGYAKRQLAGERNPPQVDAINQILLRACALVEYNGDRWYGVHPLVIDNLKELGRVG